MGRQILKIVYAALQTEKVEILAQPKFFWVGTNQTVKVQCGLLGLAFKIKTKFIERLRNHSRERKLKYGFASVAHDLQVLKYELEANQVKEGIFDCFTLKVWGSLNSKSKTKSVSENSHGVAMASVFA